MAEDTITAGGADLENELDALEQKSLAAPREEAAAQAGVTAPSDLPANEITPPIISLQSPENAAVDQAAKGGSVDITSPVSGATQANIPETPKAPTLSWDDITKQDWYKQLSPEQKVAGLNAYTAQAKDYHSSLVGSDPNQSTKLANDFWEKAHDKIAQETNTGGFLAGLQKTATVNTAEAEQAGLRAIQDMVGQTSYEKVADADKQIDSLKKEIANPDTNDRQKQYAQTQLDDLQKNRDLLAAGGAPEAGRTNADVLNRRAGVQKVIDYLEGVKMQAGKAGATPRGLDWLVGGNINPEAKPTQAQQVGGAVASVADMAMGSKVMLAKMAGSTWEGAYEHALITNGGDKAAAAQTATGTALKISPVLLAYAAGGKIAGLGTKLLPESAGLFTRFATGAATSSAANLAVSSSLRKIQGGNLVGNTEQNAQDILFGAVGGFHEMADKLAPAAKQLGTEVAQADAEFGSLVPKMKAAGLPESEKAASDAQQAAHAEAQKNFADAFEKLSKEAKAAPTAGARVSSEAQAPVAAGKNGETIVGPALADKEGNIISRGDFAQKGEQTHAELLDREITNGNEGKPEQVDKALDVFGKDFKQGEEGGHGFIARDAQGNERVVDRAEAAKIGGLKTEKAQSQDFIEQQKGGENTNGSNIRQSENRGPGSTGLQKTSGRPADERGAPSGRTNGERQLEGRETSGPRDQTPNAGIRQGERPGSELEKRKQLTESGRGEGAPATTPLSKWHLKYAAEQAAKAKTIKSPSEIPPNGGKAEGANIEEVAHNARRDLDKQIQLPEGASFIRATDAKGRKSIVSERDLKGANPLHEAGPFAKIEAGIMTKGGKFEPMKEPVSIREALQAPDIAKDLPDSEKAHERATAATVEEIAKAGRHKIEPAREGTAPEQARSIAPLKGEQPNISERPDSTVIGPSLADSVGRNYNNVRAVIKEFGLRGNDRKSVEARAELFDKVRDDLLKNTQDTGDPGKLANGATYSAKLVARHLAINILDRSENARRAQVPFHAAGEETEGRSIEETAAAPKAEEKPAIKSDEVAHIRARALSAFSKWVGLPLDAAPTASRDQIVRAAGLAADDIFEKEGGRRLGPELNEDRFAGRGRKGAINALRNDPKFIEAVRDRVVGHIRQDVKALLGQDREGLNAPELQKFAREQLGVDANSPDGLGKLGEGSERPGLQTAPTAKTLENSTAPYPESIPVSDLHTDVSGIVSKIFGRSTELVPAKDARRMQVRPGQEGKIFYNPENLRDTLNTRIRQGWTREEAITDLIWHEGWHLVDDVARDTKEGAKQGEEILASPFGRKLGEDHARAYLGSKASAEEIGKYLGDGLTGKERENTLARFSAEFAGDRAEMLRSGKGVAHLWAEAPKSFIERVGRMLQQMWTKIGTRLEDRLLPKEFRDRLASMQNAARTLEQSAVGTGLRLFAPDIAGMRNDAERQNEFLNQFAETHGFESVNHFAVEDPVLFNEANRQFRRAQGEDVGAQILMAPDITHNGADNGTADSNDPKIDDLYKLVSDKFGVDAEKVAKEAMASGATSKADFAQAFEKAGLKPSAAEAVGQALEAHVTMAGAGKPHPFDPERVRKETEKKVSEPSGTVGSLREEVNGGLWDRMKTTVEAAMNKTFPKTTNMDRVSGEKMGRWVSSPIAAPFHAAEFLAEVLKGSDVDAEKFGAALTEDNLRSVKQGFLDKGEQESADKVHSIIGTDKSPFKTEAEYQKFLADPAVKQAIERHIAQWNEVVEPMFKAAMKIDPDEQLPTRGLQTGARVNLFADKEGKTVGRPNTVGVGNLRGTMERKSPFGRQAKGTGNYRTNYGDMISNTFARQLDIANKNDFEKQLVESGNAVIAKPGETPVLSNGEATKAFPLKTSSVITKDGKAIPLNKNLYVRESLANEYERAANVQTRALPAEIVSKITTPLNNAALAGFTDFTVHVSNLFTALTTRPSVSGGLLRDSLLSLTGRADALVSFGKLITKSLQDNQGQLKELAEIGALRETHATGSKYNPLTWSGKAIHWMDTSTRLMLDDAYKSMVKEGWVPKTETARREFVNQVGQYNRRAQNALVRLFRDTGIGPFATAGTTFNALGIRMATLSPGVQASSGYAAAALRANVLSKWVGAGVLVAGLNYSITGKMLGRPGIPFGNVDTGRDDKNGRPLSIPVFDLLGLGRAMRVIGARGAIDAYRKGLTNADIRDSAYRDIWNSAVSPFAGPPIRFGMSLGNFTPFIGAPKPAPIAAPGESQGAANIVNAIVKANPIAASIQQYRQGAGLVQAVQSQFPRFVPKSSQPLEMMTNYPEIVHKAQAAGFMEDVVHRARYMEPTQRTNFIRDSLQRLAPSDRPKAIQTLRWRRVAGPYQ